MAGFESVRCAGLCLSLGRVVARLVVEDEAGRHVGLGLYRHRSCESQGYVVASLAPVAAIERRVRAEVGALRAAGGMDDGEAIEHAQIRLAHDRGIDVWLVFVDYPPLPLLVEGCPEERVAIAVAAGCLAEELVSDLDARIRGT